MGINYQPPTSVPGGDQAKVIKKIGCGVSKNFDLKFKKGSTSKEFWTFIQLQETIIKDRYHTTCISENNISPYFWHKNDGEM